MTDITDQDRSAYEWAQMAADNNADPSDAPWRIVARHYLDTVDAPAPTLAEELRYRADLLDSGDPAGGTPQALRDLAADAAQMERDLAEARAKVERLKRDLAEAYKTRDAKDDEVDSLRAEVDRLTAVRVTDPSLTLNDGSMTPDPAAVKPGEAWTVKIDGVGIVPGFKSSVGWICYRLFGGTTNAIGDKRITLVSRLVPEPRQIATREELDALPDGTIIRDHADGEAMQKIDGDWRGTDGGEGYDDYCPTATVLWEPEV